MPIEELFSFGAVAVALIPVTTGIIEVIKRLGLDSKFAPLLSILVGIALMFLTIVAWQVAVAQGIIIGLAASGLYSGTTRTGSAIKSMINK